MMTINTQMHLSWLKYTMWAAWLAYELIVLVRHQAKYSTGTVVGDSRYVVRNFELNISLGVTFLTCRDTRFVTIGFLGDLLASNYN